MAYDPASPLHKRLCLACAAGETVTIQVAIRDGSGNEVDGQESVCNVARCRISMEARLVRNVDRGNRLIAELDLEAAGAVRDIA